MTNEYQNIGARIVREFRDLLTEAERRADRAFVFAARVRDAADAESAKEFAAPLEQALADPEARVLFEQGRAAFLGRVARRVVAERPESLPRCPGCGELFKSPNPKLCFDCDYRNLSLSKELPDE